MVLLVLQYSGNRTLMREGTTCSVQKDIPGGPPYTWGSDPDGLVAPVATYHLWSLGHTWYTPAMPTEKPPQPEMSPNGYENISRVNNYRIEVMAYARQHEGLWIDVWMSPTPVTMKALKRKWKKHIFGTMGSVRDREGADHGHWSDEGWSVRTAEGTILEIRYNGPWSVGMSPVPAWRAPRINDDEFKDAQTTLSHEEFKRLTEGSWD